MATLRLLRGGAADDGRADEPVYDGDLEATLDALFPRVRAWLHRLLGARSDLDDATQDTLIEIARSLDSFTGESKLTTWAHRIAARVAYRYMGKRGRAHLSFDDLAEGRGEVVDGRDPERRSIERAGLRRFRALLAELPEAQQLAFVLCVVEGLPHAEAAVVSECSLETLRARLKRGRAALRDKVRSEPALAGWVEEDAS